jgi:uncharacterized membrane protein YczE
MNIKKISNILLFGIIIGFSLFLFSKNYNNYNNHLSFLVKYTK